MKRASKKHTILTFAVLCPILLVFSFLSSQWYDGRKQDFSQYWQAGHMILAGQNVYDSAQWISVHQIEGTAAHTNPAFYYPLPLAVLFIPLAMLPVQTAYILWVFFTQIAVLASIALLLEFYPARSGYLELLTIAGIFFFRPMFSIANSGQIITPLMLLLVLSMRLFHRNKWFLGGLALSAFSLKPSLGFPILFFAGLWLLSRRQWRGIWGMIAGGLALALVGALVSYRWPIDYLNVSRLVFNKYYGLYPTLWGVVAKIFTSESLSVAVDFVGVAAAMALEAYLFWKPKAGLDVFSAFASILPTALLVAPYAWNYDQILLVVPIVFLLINISIQYGIGKAALFMLGIVALAFAMVAVAYQVSHDVWSCLNSLVVWIVSLWFIVKNDRSGEQKLLYGDITTNQG